MNTLHPLILSNKEEKLEWENTELLVVKSDQDLVEAVKKLKQQPGKDLGVPGGIRTAQTFVRLGLIDEYVLMVHPVAIGKGQRVFTTGLTWIGKHKDVPSGVMRVCYRPALALKGKNTMATQQNNHYAEPGKQEMLITREFDAPRELVFQASPIQSLSSGLDRGSPVAKN